jgi:hypothetical protein
MITFLAVAFFLAFCAMVGWCAYLRQELDRTEKQCRSYLAEKHQAYDELEKALDNYAALEQGTEEIEESYQQEALEAFDKAEEVIGLQAEVIRDKIEEIEALEEALEYHMQTCLPDLTTIRLESLIRKELEAAIPE